MKIHSIRNTKKFDPLTFKKIQTPYTQNHANKLSIPMPNNHFTKKVKMNINNTQRRKNISNIKNDKAKNRPNSSRHLNKNPYQNVSNDYIFNHAIDNISNYNKVLSNENINQKILRNFSYKNFDLHQLKIPKTYENTFLNNSYKVGNKCKVKKYLKLKDFFTEKNVLYRDDYLKEDNADNYFSDNNVFMNHHEKNNTKNKNKSNNKNSSYLFNTSKNSTINNTILLQPHPEPMPIKLSSEAFKNSNLMENESMRNSQYLNKRNISQRTNKSDHSNDKSIITEDDKLVYVLDKLKLSNLYTIFKDNSIGFSDLFLLTKEDFVEMKISIGQRNRLMHFLMEFRIYSKKFSIQEIKHFFESEFNKNAVNNNIIIESNYTNNISTIEFNKSTNTQHPSNVISPKEGNRTISKFKDYSSPKYENTKDFELDKSEGLRNMGGNEKLKNLKFNKNSKFNEDLFAKIEIASPKARNFNDEYSKVQTSSSFNFNNASRMQRNNVVNIERTVTSNYNHNNYDIAGGISIHNTNNNNISINNNDLSCNNYNELNSIISNAKSALQESSKVNRGRGNRNCQNITLHTLSSEMDSSYGVTSGILSKRADKAKTFLFGIEEDEKAENSKITGKNSIFGTSFAKKRKNIVKNNKKGNENIIENIQNNIINNIEDQIKQNTIIPTSYHSNMTSSINPNLFSINNDNGKEFSSNTIFTKTSNSNYLKYKKPQNFSKQGAYLSPRGAKTIDTTHQKKSNTENKFRYSMEKIMSEVENYERSLEDMRKKSETRDNYLNKLIYGNKLKNVKKDIVGENHKENYDLDYLVIEGERDFNEELQKFLKQGKTVNQYLPK